MKSLEFLKPTLATTLALVLAWLISVRPAQAGYVVTLQQVGPDVVATGSGAINLHGLTFYQSSSQDPAISSSGGFASIYTGPTSSIVDLYGAPNGPTSFGMHFASSASSGSGDMVGIVAGYYVGDYLSLLSVPTGYVSGYCSIGQRDLQRHDSCRPGRNTGHLRMDVGNHSEPELHAYNPTGPPTGDQRHQHLDPRPGVDRR